MANDLTFYTHPMSRGRIVRWMLEETGAAYETEVLDYDGAMKSAAYRAINPMGKVPAIKHGETVVTECAAICAYLADAFPAAGLAPPVTSRLRGDYYRWLFFAAGPLEAAATNKAMGFEVPEERRKMAGYGSLIDVLDTLEGAVSNRKFIVGDAFSAADVYLCSHLAWGMMFNTIEKRPAFEAYCKGFDARPAAIRAGQIDDALMAKHPIPKRN